MTWRKFRQRVCWLLGGRDEWECYVMTHTSWPGELICEDCEHNKWNRRTEVTNEQIQAR